MDHMHADDTNDTVHQQHQIQQQDERVRIVRRCDEDSWGLDRLMIQEKGVKRVKERFSSSSDTPRSMWILEEPSPGVLKR